MTRPGIVGGVAAVLLLVALMAAGRAMIGLTPSTVDSSGSRQTDPTPTKTPKPVLKISPSSAVPNQTVTLTGTNFTDSFTSGGAGPADVHQITGNGSSVITLAGETLQEPKVSYPVNLDTGENLLVTVTLPVNSVTLASGSVVMSVTDSAGKSDSANISFPKRTLKLVPDKGARGTVFTATGAGFPASNSATNVYSIQINYGDSLVTFSPVTDADGKFESTFDVPKTARIPSSNTVAASAAGTTATATDTHTVPAPTITIDPDSASPGTMITITGVDYPGFATTSTLTIGSLSVLPGSPPTTTKDGGLTTTVMVPGLDEGIQILRLTAGGVSASTSFEVSALEATPTPTPTATPLPSMEPSAAMGPLADNFLEVWRFDNSTQQWTFYLPDPDFAQFNSLTQLATGTIYLLRVKEPQTVTLNGSERNLFQGWNTIAW